MKELLAAMLNANFPDSSKATDTIKFFELTGQYNPWAELLGCIRDVDSNCSVAIIGGRNIVKFGPTERRELQPMPTNEKGSVFILFDDPSQTHWVVVKITVTEFNEMRQQS